MNNKDIENAVKSWVEQFVVKINLCPFAKREIDNNRVRFLVSEATSEEQLLEDLLQELKSLSAEDSIETTLLIHPQVLSDFDDYNQFLNVVDALLVESKLEGVFQIASFHPQYQFAGTEPNDAENFTNRSPYPILHILREESLEKAIDIYPDVDQIPVRNVECMNELGLEKIQALIQEIK